LFEVKIKNKPDIFFPKSFSDELGGVPARHQPVIAAGPDVPRWRGRGRGRIGRMAIEKDDAPFEMGIGMPLFGRGCGIWGGVWRVGLRFRD
jgi:hypothetical protein